MPGESKQQELAEAIGKVIIPMVKTGDGIDDGPIQEFLRWNARCVLENLQSEIDEGHMSPKQP